MKITEALRKKTFDLLDQFRNEGMTVINQGITLPFRKFDDLRAKSIPEIHGLLSEFLSAKIDLAVFRSKHEALTRKFDYWGFKSFSGQGFLNQINKWSNGSAEVVSLLRASFRVPTSEDEAAQRIRQFRAELSRLIPTPGLRLASVPTLLSYFWQIQAPETLPMFYASGRKVIAANGLPEDDQEPGQAYVDFWRISDELFALFKKRMDLEEVNRYWFVEHVLWLEYRAVFLKVLEGEAVGIEKKSTPKASEESFHSYLPPVIQDLEAHSSRKTGDSLEFERKVILAFRMLGFLVDGLGQGHGREPDGIAKSNQDHFAILFDAKSSQDGYSVGTGDRAIIEYINRKDSDLRKAGFRNIYFVLVSSRFAGDSDGAIKSVLRETAVKSVVLMTANQLLRIVAHRIANPYSFDMGSFEELLLSKGKIDEEQLEDFLQS